MALLFIAKNIDHVHRNDFLAMRHKFYITSSFIFIVIFHNLQCLDVFHLKDIDGKIIHKYADLGEFGRSRIMRYVF